MEEDWGRDANEPPFSLFRDANPEDEAVKDGFVCPTVYQRWTRSQRRLFQQLKTEHIARKIIDDKMKSMNQICEALEELIIYKEDVAKEEPGAEKGTKMSKLDEVIGQLEKMKMDAAVKSEFKSLGAPVSHSRPNYDIKPDLSQLKLAK